MTQPATITVTLYQAKPGRFRRRAQTWRWKAQAANGRVLADSGEAYRDRASAIQAINLLFNTANIYNIDLGA